MGLERLPPLNAAYDPNEHDGEPCSAGELPIYRALTPAAEACLIRERFADPLIALRRGGRRVDAGRELRLNRAALFHVGRRVHEFFLLGQRNARHA